MYQLDQRLDVLSHPIVQTWGNSTRAYSLGHLQNYEIAEQHKDPSCKCYIVPPHLQKKIQELKENNENQQIRIAASVHLGMDKGFRDQRRATIKLLAKQNTRSGCLPCFPCCSKKSTVATYPGPVSDFNSTPFIQNLTRTVSDAQNKEVIPEKPVMSMIGEANLPGYISTGSTADETVNKAFENALNVFLFYLNQYQYDSIDGKNLPIHSVVHYGENFENAFWDGTEMVYGDGDQVFKHFVDYLDVVGHELTHGVTGPRLIYKKEPGALNESFSDVMGYLVYMYTNKLDVTQAKWLLADGILQYNGNSYPLRSFSNPGSAYDIPELGKDPQPPTYGGLYKGTEDDGGVHINSGIPNRAFYLFATAVGGNAWEKAGLVWFITMMTPKAFKSDASMKDFANATIKTATTLFKEDQQLCDALRKAWKTVEVL